MLLSYKLYDIFSYVVEYGYPFIGKGKAVSTGKNLNTTSLSGYSLKGFLGYSYKDFELMIGINPFKKKYNDFYDNGRNNYLNEYEINQVKIHHYDLFRLKSAEEVKNLNLFESYSKAITLIEWPQIIKEKPKNLIEFKFNYEDDHKKRSVQIKGLNLS